MHLPSWAICVVDLGPYLVVGGILFAFFRTPITWNFPGVLAAAAAGLAGGFALFFFFKALATGPASMIVPFTSLYPVLTVILSVFFLHESLTARHLAGIILATLAVWLLSN